MYINYDESQKQYQAKIKQWIEDNTTRHIKNQWINNLEWAFYLMADGWVAVFRAYEHQLYPYAQYDTLDHAIGYLSMIENITVPFTII